MDLHACKISGVFLLVAVGNHPSGRCENICANERRRFMANFNICCGDVNLMLLFGTLDCKWNVKWMQRLADNDLDQCFAPSKNELASARSCGFKKMLCVLDLLNDQPHFRNASLLFLNWLLTVSASRC